mmetsp:Transcript_11310/g.26203  ORF Transcript_11310/g.26203 Transcript_11310/m.26203 type:complete len:123 (+) Transcript_11310:717-1085(+)
MRIVYNPQQRQHTQDHICRVRYHAACNNHRYGFWKEITIQMDQCVCIGCTHCYFDVSWDSSSVMGGASLATSERGQKLYPFEQASSVNFSISVGVDVLAKMMEPPFCSSTSLMDASERMLDQ